MPSAKGRRSRSRRPETPDRGPSEPRAQTPKANAQESARSSSESSVLKQCNCKSMTLARGVRQSGVKSGRIPRGSGTHVSKHEVKLALQAQIRYTPSSETPSNTPQQLVCNLFENLVQLFATFLKLFIETFLQLVLRLFLRLFCGRAPQT